MQVASRLRVLVVDDEQSIRELVKRVLQRAGFETVEAVDGEDAIRLLAGADFDALVLDLMMPRVDGFGVVEHLIQTRPALVEKTVVMTAYPKVAAAERLHHICCIVSKPFDLTELVGQVRTAANR